MRNRRHLLTGLASLVVAALAVAGVAWTLRGGNQDSYPVTVEVDRAGQLLATGGDVKMRGILVGRIGSVELSPPDDAVITLELDRTHRIPADVTVAIRGKTLFGEKLVELRRKPGPVPGYLQAGDHIPIQRTEDIFELEDVLRTAEPVLESIEPGDLGDALKTLGRGFGGQQAALGRTIDNGVEALRAVNSRSGDLRRLLEGAPGSTDALGRSTPDLAISLKDIGLLTEALDSRSGEVQAALKDIPRWMDPLAVILDNRLTDLIDISNKGVDVLDVVAKNRANIPPTVSGLRLFSQDWVNNLSVGCFNASGQHIGEVFPELANSTCWQIWSLSAENARNEPYEPGEAPSPNAATRRAFRAQLETKLGVPFGTALPPIAELLYSAAAGSSGMLEESPR